MTRRVIVREGTYLRDDVFLAKGALRMEDDEIPVTMWMGSSRTDDFVGKARDFQRDEETGDISLEIELFDKYKDVLGRPDTDYSLDSSNVEGLKLNGDRSNVTAARARAVVAIPFSGIPKMVADVRYSTPSPVPVSARTERYFRETLGNIEVEIYKEGDTTLDFSMDHEDGGAFELLDYDEVTKLILLLARAQTKLKRKKTDSNGD